MADIPSDNSQVAGWKPLLSWVSIIKDNGWQTLLYAAGKKHWVPTVLTDEKSGETKEENVDRTKEWSKTKGKTLGLLCLIFYE